MRNSHWYISEQVQRIQDNIELLESIVGFRPSVKEALQTILLSSYKIEAEALGIDLSELMRSKNEKTKA